MFTHNGKRLWTSLHNAFGITVQDTNHNPLELKYQNRIKKVSIEDKLNKNIKNLEIPFIKTEMTPKILRATPNQERVCVANWHSASISVIDSETGKNYGSIKVGSVPRGIAYTSDSKLGFVANFSGNSLTCFDPYNIKNLNTLERIGTNPRHLLISPDNQFLYISFHGDGYLRRLDIKNNKLKELYIGGQVRSISADKNFDYIFADSFSNNQVALVDTKQWKVIEKVKSSYHPVGISYNDKTKEVWVVNQGDSSLNIFKFNQ
ncbi:MAG: hypothetical protein WC413_04125 [Candidatus Nanoarchaeia archaeon]